jgi:hypothetical protein
MIAGIGARGGLNISQQCRDLTTPYTAKRERIKGRSVHHQMPGDLNQRSPLQH